MKQLKNVCMVSFLLLSSVCFSHVAKSEWRKTTDHRYLFNKTFTHNEINGCWGVANAAGFSVRPWSNGYAKIISPLPYVGQNKYWFAKVSVSYKRFNSEYLISPNKENIIPGFFYGFHRSNKSDFAFSYIEPDAYLKSRKISSEFNPLQKNANAGDPFWDSVLYPEYPNRAADPNVGWNDFAGTDPSTMKNGLLVDALIRKYWNIQVQNGESRPYVLKVRINQEMNALEVYYPCILPASVAFAAYSDVADIENLSINIDAHIL